MPRVDLPRKSVRLLGAAWCLVLLGAVVLAIGYPGLPERVVLYRPPWANEPITGLKSLLTVGRIAIMGAGQLGAATAMVFATSTSTHWEVFWRRLGMAAGAKTALECTSLVTQNERGLDHVLTSATIAVVAVCLVMAARQWRRGDLREHPRIAGAPWTWVIVSLGTWFVFAIAPRFV